MFVYSRRSILLLGHVFLLMEFILKLYGLLFQLLFLALIASPSFVLLYAIDTLIEPSYTLKVIGGQWYRIMKFQVYLQIF